ncbi:MAG: hypothetical protein FJ278_02705 [Planctomycetes bacterium]|nr:hypothetical protein [Planctomycetota bacterium]
MKHSLSSAPWGLLLAAISLSTCLAAVAAGEANPSAADVRALWKVEQPLFRELLSAKPPGLARHGAIMWAHLINKGPLTAWALRNGVPYSLDETLRLHGQHKLHLLWNPASLLADLDTYRGWHEKHGVRFAFYAFYWDREAEAKYHHVLDPDFTEEGLRVTAELLQKAPQLAGLIYTGDEQIHAALRDGAELFEKGQEKYPRIKDIDRQVREHFGFGKYGIPTSDKDTDPFRRSAFARWTLAQVVERQKRLHEAVRKAHPTVPIVSTDPMTGIFPFEYARQAPWVDIFTNQSRIGLGLNESVTAACIAKLLADTTGREMWPCCHINATSDGNIHPGPEEVREMHSLLFAHGATGFHAYTPDNCLRGKPGDTKNFYFGDPERWRALLELLDRSRDLPPLAFPTPDFAVFYSNDAYQATNRPGRGGSSHVINAFAFLSPVARAWFRFLDETNLSQTPAADLARLKAIVVPFAKYCRREVPERLLAYVKSGGTLVCADPEAFSFHLDGSDTSALREELLGVALKEALKEDKADVRLAASPLWQGCDTSQALPIQTPWFRVQPRPGGEALATFPDGSPAIVLAKIGQGRTISFAFSPFQIRPFSRGRDWLSDAVFNPVWQSFLRALLRGRGIQLDHDIYRFRFPSFERVYEPAPTSLCLTGNHVEWKREQPLTPHNASIGRTYSYSVAPDGVADAAQGKIPFASGKLTDRGQAAKSDPSENAATRIVRWDASAAFDLTFEFAQPCRFDKAVLIHSGALPETSVACAGRPISAKVEAHDAGEDVTRTSLALAAASSAKSLTIRFGPRPSGKSFTLAEVEVWGKTE